MYSLISRGLVSRLKDERKKQWEEVQRAALAGAVEALARCAWGGEPWTAAGRHGCVRIQGGASSACMILQIDFAPLAAQPGRWEMGTGHAVRSVRFCMLVHA